MISSLFFLAAIQSCDIALTGGEVWNGNEFAEANVFIAGDRFIDAEDPDLCHSVHDITGSFLAPPFAEGHSHNIEAGWSFDGLNACYLEEGVFYVLNPLNMPVPASELRPRLAEADTVDVAFAHGALTSYHGHPEAVYVISLAPILYGNAPREAFVGEAFHTIETLSDVTEALDALEDQGADVVKLVLSNSEAHRSRSAYLRDEANWQAIIDTVRDEGSTNDERMAALMNTSVGLEPMLLPGIVDQIHERGLAAIAHVNTAHDFAVAVSAGVDTIVHTPGAYLGSGYTVETGTLTQSAIDLAAERGIGVVATASVRPSFTADADRAALHQLQRENIRRLLDAGVPVYIGTDRWQAMASEEVSYLIEIGAMTPREAFVAWTSTSQFIFPNRQIGHIAPGYEADLLIFPADPTTSIDAMTNIDQRMKGGSWITLNP